MASLLGSDLIEGLSLFVLAVVQGITEWLPISSSGHVILFERILGISSNVAFSVALHFGTLLAVLVYFWKDIADIGEDFILGKWRTESGRMAWLLIAATIPSVIIGPLVKDSLDTIFNSLSVSAVGFGITGLFLLIASVGSRRKKNKDFGVVKSLFVGIFQAFAIIPGISRSGATISAGVIFGLNEKKAMKFSFLMSIPVIFGANILYSGETFLSSEFIWAGFVSFAVGILTLHLLYKYVLARRRNFAWFAFYCFALAAGILAYLVI